MKALFLMIVLACAAACSQPVKKADAREIFNAGKLHVITSFANRSQQTMSVLYGNDAAGRFALSGYRKQSGGELFKLIVYKQAGNKYWYGSYINGAIKSIEMVAADKPGQLTYKLERGVAPAGNSGKNMTDAERITSILSHKPSVFP